MRSLIPPPSIHNEFNFFSISYNKFLILIMVKMYAYINIRTPFPLNNL